MESRGKEAGSREQGETVGENNERRRKE